MSDVVALQAGVGDPKNVSFAVSDKGGMFLPGNLQEAMTLATVMSQASYAVSKPLRKNPGACLAVIGNASRWGMDPFAVASKVYLVNDNMAYEAQLIIAVINTRSGLFGRLKVTYEGEGQTRQCFVSGKFARNEEPSIYASPRLADIKTKNSPLWASDPDQQLAYYSQRAWARRFCPEVIMGVYSGDELLEQESSVRVPRDITPPEPPSSEVDEVAEQGDDAEFNPGSVVADLSGQLSGADSLETIEEVWIEADAESRLSNFPDFAKQALKLYEDRKAELSELEAGRPEPAHAHDEEPEMPGFLDRTATEAAQ